MILSLGAAAEMDTARLDADDITGRAVPLLVIWELNRRSLSLGVKFSLCSGWEGVLGLQIAPVRLWFPQRSMQLSAPATPWSPEMRP